MKYKKPSVTLAVIHNIHLTKEQCEDLASGNSIQVVGAQVPVWHSFGRTSEPAVEVFCRYVLHNSPDIDDRIIQNSWGYEFNIPQLPDNYTPRPFLTDEQWLSMSVKEINQFHSKHPQIHTAEDLANSEGQGPAQISFNQKSLSSAHGVPINILHYVRISRVEHLVDSLI